MGEVCSKPFLQNKILRCAFLRVRFCKLETLTAPLERYWVKFYPRKIALVRWIPVVALVASLQVSPLSRPTWRNRTLMNYFRRAHRNSRRVNTLSKARSARTARSARRRVARGPRDWQMCTGRQHGRRVAVCEKSSLGNRYYVWSIDFGIV